jgi:hypothetical protein
VHVIVLDSVLHCGTTIAVINAKPIERQHVSTTHCRRAGGPFIPLWTCTVHGALMPDCFNYARVLETMAV